MTVRALSAPAAKFCFKESRRMTKHFAIALALTVASAGLAQSSAHSSDPVTRHYRLIFVVDSGEGEMGKQSFVLDVPVAPSKMGVARANLISGSDRDKQSVTQQLFECSNVHASSTGLALHIAMQSDREAPAIPGLVSARHQHGEFQRSVDLQLGKPTVVTQEMHFRVLGNTDPELASKLKQPAPTITVTAEAL
ncbi:hypothetical protein AciPR4_1272 [Terriglobus saanensis SP1PR4]|uniref:Uncharacterized protein n=2 Tax=Terriglobus saanensis TaxID=870903 RepID=E8UZ78_TERSS|nr:hypothetical protein AciPR4_1272 [Terriglobus saanensis SP1PR4]